MVTFSRRSLLGLVAGTTLAFAGAARAADPIKVGTDATFPPFEYTEAGKRTGFDVELIEAIGKVLNRPIEWTEIDF